MAKFFSNESSKAFYNISLPLPINLENITKKMLKSVFMYNSYGINDLKIYTDENFNDYFKELAKSNHVLVLYI